MELEQYTNLAVRTEKVKPILTANKDYILAVLRMFKYSGELLDQIKKNIFYNKEIDFIKAEEYLNSIDESFRELNFAPLGMKDWFERDASVITQSDIESRMFHSLIGTCTESAELAHALEQFLTNGSFDFINVMEEYGDIFWYAAIGSDTSKIKLSSCTTKNIEKLAKRYPDGFSDYFAQNRDLESERDILETMNK